MRPVIGERRHRGARGARRRQGDSTRTTKGKGTHGGAVEEEGIGTPPKIQDVTVPSTTAVIPTLFRRLAPHKAYKKVSRILLILIV